MTYQMPIRLPEVTYNNLKLCGNKAIASALRWAIPWGGLDLIEGLPTPPREGKLTGTSFDVQQFEAFEQLHKRTGEPRARLMNSLIHKYAGRINEWCESNMLTVQPHKGARVAGAFVYVAIVRHGNVSAVKFGITENLTQRLSAHRSIFASRGGVFAPLRVFRMKTIDDAKRVESALQGRFRTRYRPQVSMDIDSCRTELTPISNLLSVLAIVESRSIP